FLSREEKIGERVLHLAVGQLERVAVVGSKPALDGADALEIVGAAGRHRPGEFRDPRVELRQLEIALARCQGKHRRRNDGWNPLRDSLQNAIRRIPKALSRRVTQLVGVAFTAIERRSANLQSDRSSSEEKRVGFKVVELHVVVETSAGGPASGANQVRFVAA